jgi:uncharacterized membrane protein
VVIASYGSRHHRLVASVVAIDTPVIVANLALIAAIVLLPFTTEAVGDPSVDHLPLPTVVLVVNVAAASLLHVVVYLMASWRGLLAARPTRDELIAHLPPRIMPAAVFLVSIPLAYLTTPVVAQLSWLSLLVIGPVARQRAPRAGEDSA